MTGQWLGENGFGVDVARGVGVGWGKFPPSRVIKKCLPVTGHTEWVVYKTIMRRLPRPICAGSIAGFLAALSLLSPRARAATYYWDINGSTAGSGGSTPSGAWSDSKWSTDPLGLSATSSWLAGSTAAFSAGSDATGSYNITVGQTFDIGGLIFKDGSVTISGAGALNLSTASAEFFVGSGLASQLNVNLTGSAALRKTGTGTLRLGSATNTFNGPLTISAGVISITDAGALGTGNSVITVEGTTNRGQGGGSLVVGGDVFSGITIDRTLFVSGGGVSGDASALTSMGNNTFSSVATGTAASTRIFSMGGTTTINGLVVGVGQTSGFTTQLNGPGHFVVSNVIVPGVTSTVLEKSGNGGMILSGDNLIDNEVRVSGGSLRIADGTGLPILSGNGGTLELRTDNVASYTARFIGRNSTTLFLDHAAGSSQGILNQTLTFADSTFANAGQNFTLNSRNGYGVTFALTGSTTTFTGDGNTQFTNGLTGKLIFDGKMTTTLGNSRVFTIGNATGGNGDAEVTDSITFSGGFHTLAKSGTGTLKLDNDNSSYGTTNINGGTLIINKLTATGNGALTLGSGGVTGALSYLGTAGTGAGDTTSRVFSLNGAGGNGAILANQSGSAVTPLVLTSNIGAPFTGTGNKVLFLGGSAAVDNTLNGVISNSFTSTTAVTKVGSGTWVLSPTAGNYFTSLEVLASTAAVANNVANTATTIDLAAGAGASLSVGQYVQGTNVPAGAVITAINGDTITISAAVTGAITAGASLNFNTLGKTATTSGTGAANSNVIPIANVASLGLVVGQSVAGANVPVGSVITAINTGNNTISISNSIGTTAVASGTKLGFGQVSTFTGNVTVTGGTLKIQPTTNSGLAADIIPTASTLTFAADALSSNQTAGSTFEYVGVSGVTNLEQLGSLNASAGANTVKATGQGVGGTADLRFSSLGTFSAGASVNLVPTSGGAVTLPTGTTGIPQVRLYFNGADFAYYPGGVGGAFRAPSYGETGTNTVAASAGLTPGSHNLITSTSGTSGTVTQGTAISINSLKMDGNRTLTANAALTIPAILVNGGNAIINTSATGSITASNTDIAIRVNGASDSLTINVPIANTTSTSVTKSGAGTLILGSGSNAETGTVTVNEGLLKLASTANLGGAGVNLTVRQGATFDLNGVNLGSSGSATNAINALIGSGVITNSAAGTAVASLRIGNSGGNGVFTGTIQNGATAPISVVKAGGGVEMLAGLNTYTGQTVLAGGTLQAPSLANIGQPSSIGTGLSGSNALNADSLVFNGGILQYIGSTSGTTAIALATQTPSISIDRLFTIGLPASNGPVAATLDSSGSFGNIVAGRSPNSATLVFNNTAPVVFAGLGTRQLTLQGDSTGDNEIKLQLTNNGTSAFNLVKAGAGVWILGNSTNNYTGATSITGGILRAVDGVTLPSTSNLIFNGGTFESRSNTFTRSLGGGTNQVQWTGSGGFSADESRLTVAIGGLALPSALTWGSGGFVPDANALLLGSAVSQAEIEFKNAINLGSPGATAARTVQVDDNGATALDFAIMSGLISSGNANAVLTKTGAGTLYLTNDQNSYTGNTSITAGTIIVSSIGSIGAGPSQLGARSNSVLISNGTLSYVGTGETTDRPIVMNGNTTIDASGSGPLVVTGLVNSAGTKTLTLSGFGQDANELRSVLADNGGTLSVTKAGLGTWVISGDNTYSGATNIGNTVGAVGIGHDHAFGNSSLVTVTNASLFAAGGDRTFTNNVLFAGNATEAVFGDNNLTIGNGSTSITFGNNSNTTNLSNFLVPGKVLTLNGTVLNFDVNADRRLNINGTGNTVINANIVDQPTNNRKSEFQYSGTGLVKLAGSNTYSGPTIVSNGAIQGVAGSSFSPNSALQIAGGVFQTSGTIGGVGSLPLGTGPGQVAWTSNGGFAAAGNGAAGTNNLNVGFNSGAELVWGVTPNFVPAANSLIFGSTTADSTVFWTNPIDLNPVLNTNVTRTFTVNDNPDLSTDQVVLQGFLRQSNLSNGGTGTVSITKAGLGTLIIESGAMSGSNAFNGTISVTGGTLQLGTTTNASPLAGVGGSYNMTPSATGTNLILNHITMLRAGDFTANAGTAVGGITVSGTSDSSIQLNVAATTVTRNYVISDNPLVADDVIFSVPLVNGPGGSGMVHLTKQGAGTLVFQGNNTLQGATVLYKGSLVYDYSLSTGGKLSDLGDLELRGGAMVFKGNASADVTETVGNLSPGSSNLGKQIALQNDNPANSNPNTFGTFTNNTTASLGAQSSITLQPTNGRKLTLNFGGFIRNPGGGIVLLSATNADGSFTTSQPGDLNNGRLLAVNALLDGRWIARDGFGKIIQHTPTVENNPGNWNTLQTAELNGPTTGTLATNRVPGLIISGSNTELTIANPSASLMLTTGGLLVPTGTPASLIKITGGKIMTQLPYKSAQGADLLIENFGTGVLSISSNLGYSEAPQGNAQFITIAGTGITEISGQNSSMITYIGGTRITGAVKIIGGSTLRIGGDGVTSDAISDYLPVDFGSTGDVAGTLQLNGHSETIGGIVTPGSTNQGTNNAIIDLGTGGALTVNQLAAVSYNGTITGSGSFTKQGNATFTVASLAGNNPLTFTGSVTVGGGLLALTGNQSDGLTGADAITIRGGELQAEHNSGGLLTINKLSDNAIVKLDGTINQGLRITSNTSGRFENIKRIDLVAGANTITVDSANTTSQLTLRATESGPGGALTRGTKFSTLLIKGDNLGGGLGGALNNTARILLGSGTTGLGLVGGTGSTPSTYPIVPWMLGSIADPVVAVVGDSFVTYGTNGLRPLNTSTEYLFNDYAGASNLSNLSVSTTVPGTPAGKAINSLRFDASGGNVSLNLGSGTLTVNSGAVLATMGANANTVTIGDPTISAFFAPGATNELIFSVTSTNASAATAKLIVQPLITGANVSVTKTGPGTLQLTNNNTFEGGLTINQGAVEFNSAQANGNSLGTSGKEIRLAGGTLRFNDGSAASLGSRPIKLYGPSSFYTLSGAGAAGNALTRGSVIDVANTGALTILAAGTITGDGGFVKTGIGTLNIAAESTFTGSMAVMRGIVNISNKLTGASGLFIVPENVAGESPISATVNFDSSSPLNVNQVIVGGVFTAASTLFGTGTLVVGSNTNHPAVTIGNGSGDSFMAVGYHDEGAGNGVSLSITQGMADFRKASSVNINVSRLFLGQNKGNGSGRVQGDLKLPDSPLATNNITAGYVVIGNSPGPDSVSGGALVSTLDLGFGTTYLKADSITVGGQNTNGAMILNGDQNGRGSLYITDRSGSGGANLFIGDNDDITNSEQEETSTKLDTTSGSVYADLNLLVIGRHGGNAGTGSNFGGGGGKLLFKDGTINAATVQLGVTGTRVSASNPDANRTPDHTVVEISQLGGTFRFGEMSKGAGQVTYNWNEGTIENYGNRDSVNLNVQITAGSGDNDLHVISVPNAGQTMIFEASASFAGSGTLYKAGAGTLELRGGSASLGSVWEHQSGRILVNNADGVSATGINPINVYPGAELGGSGFIGGHVRLLSGPTPSSMGGKLTVGSDSGEIGTLTLLENTHLFAEAGSVIKLEIATNGPLLLGDRLLIGGLLDIDADPLGFQTNPDDNFATTAVLDITDIAPGHITSGSITLMTYSIGWTGGTGGGFDAGGYFKTPDGTVIRDYDAGNLGGSTLFYISGNAYYLDYNGGPLGSDVVLIAVPEPGALASLIGGVGMLLGLQRFRRK